MTPHLFPGSRILILTLGLTSMLVLGQPAISKRIITVNGRPLTPEQQERLERVERYYAVRIPDNAYWYDNRSGAAGFWNGPAVAALPPGLRLGGPMPSNCSGGDTGVFVNGRELNSFDVANLSYLGPVYRGRYWLDSNGNYGLEGGPLLGNLFAIARRTRAPHRVYEPGELSGLFGNSAGYCTSSGCYYPGR